MKIHKEGYWLIFIVFCLLLGVVILIETQYPVRGWINYLSYLACLVLLIFLIAFFRSPFRDHEHDPEIILSPADGKVVVIERVYDKEFIRDDVIQVSIFMSPLDVHVNWYPISGKVIHYKYHPGRYLVAWHPKSSDANERTSVVVQHDESHLVLIRQIAGALARRVVCYASIGQHVKQGTELGFIKFGSRVDLLLPKDTQILVGLNQKVKGKKTVIGRFPQH